MSGDMADVWRHGGPYIIQVGESSIDLQDVMPSNRLSHSSRMRNLGVSEG
jgi:hypothetical protein